MTDQLVESRTIDLALQPAQAAYDAPQAPVYHDRSFFDADPAFYPGRQAPIDPTTGQPYLVLPNWIHPSTLEQSEDTYHHLRYYRTDKHLGGKIGDTAPEHLRFDKVAGLAVRASIGTYLMRSTHEQLHRRFPAGPDSPKSINNKFKTAVAAAVGIVPRQMLDMSQPAGKEIVAVDEDTFQAYAGMPFSGPERFRSESGAFRANRIFSSFFLRYAATKKFLQVDSALVREITNEPDEEGRCEVAYEFLFEALQIAVKPLLPQLDRWAQEGYIQPGRQDPITELRKITAAKRVTHILPLMHDNLRKFA